MPEVLSVVLMRTSQDQPPNLQCQGCHGPGKQLPYMAGSLFHNGPHAEYEQWISC